jgi:hypothetical protein
MILLLKNTGGCADLLIEVKEDTFGVDSNEW